MQDDLHFEDDIEGVPAESHGAKKLERLEARLATSQQEKEEYLLGWQRAKADFINAKARFEKDVADVARMERMNVVASLMPFLDTLEEARKHGEEYALLYDQAWKSFADLGVSAINPEVGSVCDLTHCEHVGSEPSTYEEGAVTQVLQLGYVVDGMVIRTAKVVVSNGS